MIAFSKIARKIVSYYNRQKSSLSSYRAVDVNPKSQGLGCLFLRYTGSPIFSVTCYFKIKF